MISFAVIVLDTSIFEESLLTLITSLVDAERVVIPLSLLKESSLFELVDKVFESSDSKTSSLDRETLDGSLSTFESLDTEISDESAIFALSSISEGFPTVYVEAIRSGCYIVTSRLKYISEEITSDEKYGRICEPRDPDGFADILVDACNNKINTVSQKDIIKYVKLHIFNSQ